MAGDHGSVRAILFAFLANAGIAALKLAAAFMTHSAAMLAEGIHSLADAGNQVLLWLGHRLSQRQPSESHPFGYGKERYFWSFVVSLLLFTMGGLYSIYEGVSKLLHHHAIEIPLINVAILVVGIFLEGGSWYVAVRALTPEYRTPWAFLRYARKTKAPTLTVVIFEDTAALLGLTFALVGTLLAMLTGKSHYDALASLFIGILLVVVAWIIARETRSLLIGEGLEKKQVREIVERLNSMGVRVVDFRSLFLGPSSLLIGMVARVEKGPLTEHSNAEVITAVENEVKKMVPEAQYIYVELVDTLKKHNEAQFKKS